MGTARSDPLADVGPEHFFSLDLRVGRVTDVEPFPEARTAALKLSIDFGEHVGQLKTSAQITNYSIDDLKGKTVVAAINLGTKQIGPLRSECLVLGAVHPDRTVTLLTTDKDVEPGTVVA